MKYRGYMGVAKPQAELGIRHLDADGNVMLRRRRGFRGLFSRKLVPDVQIAHGAVTDAFVQFVVDQLQAEDATIGDFKFHDSGIGVGAEAAGDTALGTPCGIARATGTQTEGGANIYKSVATITYDGDYAVTEHGLFNIAAAGTLMDRTKFDAVNVSNTEKIEFTYQLTISSGG